MIFLTLYYSGSNGEKFLHSDEDYARFEYFFLAWRSAAEVPVLHASKLLILMYNSLLSYKRSIYVN